MKLHPIHQCCIDSHRTLLQKMAASTCVLPRTPILPIKEIGPREANSSQGWLLLPQDNISGSALTSRQPMVPAHKLTPSQDTMG